MMFRFFPILLIFILFSYCSAHAEESKETPLPDSAPGKLETIRKKITELRSEHRKTNEEMRQQLKEEKKQCWKLSVSARNECFREMQENEKTLRETIMERNRKFAETVAPYMQEFRKIKSAEKVEKPESENK